ncbi:MAG TPA: SBBP repeat-containing protein [Chitinophagaceae bacterium]|nr:SBBP repeat-containing protein [Chitinophagaceae bacterium]
MIHRYLLSASLILLASFTFISCSKQNNSPVTPPDTTATPEKWMVSTFAGSGETGTQDGDSTSAQFHYPTGIAFDSHGNLFVADLFNFNIRKITPGRKVTTYAGRDVHDSVGLEYGNIYGLRIDGNDNMYVIDYSFIRKVESPLKSEIFAGTLDVDFKDGADTSARFNLIAKMAIDAGNNIYVPDYDMQYYFKIRKVSPAAVVSTLNITDNTGFPSNGSASGGYLAAIAVDNDGNIYVTGNGNNLIKKITPDGVATVFAGAGNIGFRDGKGSDAQFNNIAGLATDASGNVFVVDGSNNAIRKITPDGTVTTIAGTGAAGFADGDGKSAKFYNPSDIVVDKKGNLYVSDSHNNRIRKLEKVN